jgi:antitoxin (DNA-binding transcriptional repressor) of toxin-antitoxin stability system
LFEVKEVTDKELQVNTEELLSHVVAGETLVITVGDRPVAKLAPRPWISHTERAELLEALTAERSARRSRTD